MGMKYSEFVDEIGGHLPPSDVGAEMCVLGSMMLDRQTLGQIILTIGREDFFQADHQIIFDMIVKLDADNKPTDATMLYAELAKRQLLEEVGGTEYLAKIISSVPSFSSGPHYAGIVREKSLLRQLIGASNNILRDAYAPHENVEDQLERAEEAVFAIAQKKVTSRVVGVKTAVEEAYEAAENRGQRGLETGYFDIDDLLNGLQKQDMIIIAARPSMGKTALALNIAEGVASNGHSVGLFSMEMGRQAIGQRFLCSAARIDSHRLRRGLLGPAEYAELGNAVQKVAKLRIYIDDSPTMTVMELRAKARRMKSAYDVKLIIIDYLQLMDCRTNKESRQQQITEISRGVKAVARELEIPVIAISQLNRQAESREGHRPRMSDLRESGSIEQDADVVALLHREDYYHFQEADFQPDNIGEIIIAKQRNGPTGVVKLYFNSKSARFENLAAQAEPF